MYIALLTKKQKQKQKQNKTKQTKQNKTKQNKTKQNKTKQNKTKQNKTKQNKTKQNKTKQKQNKTKQKAVYFNSFIHLNFIVRFFKNQKLGFKIMKPGPVSIYILSQNCQIQRFFSLLL